jgi:hypothetical protein
VVIERHRRLKDRELVWIAFTACAWRRSGELFGAARSGPSVGPVSCSTAVRKPTSSASMTNFTTSPPMPHLKQNQDWLPTNMCRLGRPPSA